MNLLGKLTWDAIPLHEPIIVGTVANVGAVILAVLAWVTVKGYWPYLWREWLTSVDHKRIGVMYLVLALLMLVRGFADGIMMRTQQAVAAGGAQGYLPPEHFDQIFSAHGTIMIFFVAMPLVIDRCDPFSPEIRPVPLYGDPCESRQDDSANAPHRAHDYRFMKRDGGPVEFAQ